MGKKLSTREEQAIDWLKNEIEKDRSELNKEKQRIIESLKDFRKEDIAKPNINAIIIRGRACPNSLIVIASVPSPLPVLEIIKRSRLKITRPHTIAKIIVAICIPILAVSE